MPRVPKPPEQLQQPPHRNKSSTIAVLDGNRKIRAPKLPERAAAIDTGVVPNWNALTLEWWRDIWRSPMAPEFLKADYHGLYVLADLIDRYWSDPDVKLAAEIRQQRQCFGLTPLDRRRLQWTVQRVEEGARKKPSKNEVVPQQDPRELIRALS